MLPFRPQSLVGMACLYNQSDSFELAFGFKDLSCNVVLSTENLIGVDSLVVHAI